MTLKVKIFLYCQKLVDQLKDKKKDMQFYREVQYLFHIKIARTFLAFPFVFFLVRFLGYITREVQSQKKCSNLFFLCSSHMFLAELFRWGGQAQLFSVVFAAWAPPLIILFLSLYFYVIQCSMPLWESMSIKKALKL